MPNSSYRRRTRGSLAIAAAALAALAPAAAVHATTSGSFVVNWTDRLGNTHPLANSQVSLYDYNTSPGVDSLIGTWVTNANGLLNFSTNYTRPGGGDLKIQLDVKAIVTNVGQFGANFGQVYTYRLPSTFSVTPNTSVGTPIAPANAGAVTNLADSGKAIGFLQGLRAANDYYKNVLGANVNYVTGRFSSAYPTGSDMSGWNLTLGYDSWGSWDVAFHEFGHGVASANALHIIPTIGAVHAMNQDNIAAGLKLGAADGTQLAWQEGIASYMGTSALNHRLPALVPGAPAADSDSWYNRLTSTSSTTPDVYLSANSFAVDLESRSGISLKYQTDANGAFVKDDNGNLIPVVDASGNYVHQTYNTFYGRGEGDELSVARVLWDLDDDTPTESLRRPGRTDQVSVGGQGAFNLMKAVGQGGGGRLSDLWHAARVAVGTTPLSRSLLGDIFETNSVSAIPGAAGGVGDGALTDSLTPTLAWSPQNAGNSTLFMVAVYSQDWSTLLQLSPQLTSTYDWQLTNPLDPGTYNWVVISNSVMQTAVSFDDSYWSGGASFTIVPEPTSLLALAATTLPAILRRRRRCRRPVA